MAANDELTRLRAENEVLVAEAQKNLTEAIERVEEKERLHLRVKHAHQRVRAACARAKAAMDEVVEAQRDMYREEDALKDYLASCARVRTIFNGTKRARAEDTAEDSAAPEPKTRRKRASG